MNRLMLGLILILVAAEAKAFWDIHEPNGDITRSRLNERYSSLPEVVTDKITCVQYLDSGESLTPRIDLQGHPVKAPLCTPKVGQDKTQSPDD